MRYGEAELEMALRQVDRAVYETEVERQAQPTSNPEVRSFCRTTLDVVNRAGPILRSGTPEQKARAMSGMTTFFYSNLEKWGGRLKSLSQGDRVLLRRCLKHLLSVIEPDPPRMK